MTEAREQESKLGLAQKKNEISLRRIDVRLEGLIYM
jgi:hypothetical protein